MLTMKRGQPKGLFLLFFTELWERFGFYTLQTIIVLYMTKGLLYDDDHAYLLYGAFSSMLYLTPVIGGYLADRFIGFNRSIVLGGILFVVGYALTALTEPHWFFLGLSTVIVANGFFKPNVSSLVGELYDPEDPRREGGFTLFYMGINIGALMPPLFTGWLVTAYGWSWGFLAASLGMVVGLTTFLVGRKRLGGAGGIPAISPLHSQAVLKKTFYLILIAGILLAIFLMHLVFKIAAKADVILILASISIILFVIYRLLQERPAQQRKMFAALILILISVGFWSIYNQTFTSMMLFADRNMTQEMLGFKIDTEFTQFYNPFFIFVLSPFLSWFWVWLDARQQNPSTPMKFSLGVLFMAFGFLFLGGAVALFNHDGVSSPWWLVGSYFLQTIGELLLSPIGLAMITRLSPRHLTGMMMGVWFLTQSASFAIGGLLSTLADVPKGATVEAASAIYSHAFTIYGLISLSLAAVGFALVPYLKKLARFN